MAAMRRISRAAGATRASEEPQKPEGLRRASMAPLAIWQWQRGRRGKTPPHVTTYYLLYSIASEGPQGPPKPAKARAVTGP